MESLLGEADKGVWLSSPLIHAVVPENRNQLVVQTAHILLFLI